MKAKYFQMKRESKSKSEMFIYDDIISDRWFESDVTATDFKNELDELGGISEIDAHINSFGGSVFEGHAIYNMLKVHPAKINIYIDALAVLIASVIAMSGDTILMHKNSFLMIHNSWAMTVGNAGELGKIVDLLKKTDAISNSAYLDKAKGLNQEYLKQMLGAETWLTTEETLSFDLIDEILGANKIAVSISKEQYECFEDIPEDLKKDVDKITRTDGVDMSELIETLEESMPLEEKGKREKIERKYEILKMTADC